jgi:hypothetical protein
LPLGAHTGVVYTTSGNNVANFTLTVTQPTSYSVTASSYTLSVAGEYTTFTTYMNDGNTQYTDVTYELANPNQSEVSLTTDGGITKMTLINEVATQMTRAVQALNSSGVLLGTIIVTLIPVSASSNTDVYRLDIEEHGN